MQSRIHLPSAVVVVDNCDDDHKYRDLRQQEQQQHRRCRGQRRRERERRHHSRQKSSYPFCFMFIAFSSWQQHNCCHAFLSQSALLPRSSSVPSSSLSPHQVFQSMLKSSSQIRMVPSSSSTSISSGITHNGKKSSSSSSSSKNPNDLEKTIVRLGRSGKTDEALSIYRSLKRPTIRHLNGIIDACARARTPRLETAFDIFEEHTVAKKIVDDKKNSRNDGETTKTGLQPNVFTFGALMNACNRARDGQKAMELLRLMESTYGVEPNEVVYSAAISACARSKPPQTKQALQLLKEAVEERQLAMSVVGFNACISACAQASDYESAISIVSRMEEASRHRQTSSAATDDSNRNSHDDGNDDSLPMETKFLVPEPDVVTYGTVLAACERGQQWRTVLKYAQSMQDRGLALDGLALMSCLHACAELGLAKNALNFLEMMKSIDPVAPHTAKFERDGARKPLSGPDAVAYRCAVTACARGGEWEEGIRLLDECKSTTGVPPNVVAYTAAITGCEYAGEWKHAFLLLDRMRKEGVEPNEMTMVAVIGACANACAKSTAQSFEFDHLHAASPDMSLPQQKALQLLNVLKNDPSTVKPNIQIYNACIRTCAEARDVHRAFDLLTEVTNAGLEKTEITYGSMMTACERVGDVKRASRLFELMKDDGIAPNEVIYGAAISCCRKANNSQRALWLLKKMIQEKLSPNTATLNTVLIAQTDNRSTTESSRILQLFKLMNSNYVAQNGRPNRQTYNILVNFFAATRQPVMAERFIDKMRESGFKPDVDLFTATVSAYERTQQPLKAVKLMKRMEEDGYDFYSVKVLNTAFKKAVGLVNAVGQSFASPIDIGSSTELDTDLDDGDITDDEFVS